MKIMRYAGALALCILAVGQVRAAEVVGGEIRLGYERFIDDEDGDTLSQLSLEGALELGIGTMGGLQADLALDRFGVLGGTGMGGTLHGLLHPTRDLSLGAFVGVEGVDDADLVFWGAELAGQRGLAGFEAYVMQAEESGSGADGTVVGLRGEYGVLLDLDLGARVEIGNFDGGLEAERYALTAAYRIGTVATLTAEIGHAEIDLPGAGGGDGGYIGVQARFAFGPDQAPSFGRRGLIDLLPGL